MSTRPHALYRFFGIDGHLLYVGITLDPGARWKQHRADKPWWTEIARVTIEHHPDRDTVLEAERAAIVTEQPRYNVVHNRGRQSTAPAQVEDGTQYDSTTNEWIVRTRAGRERVTDLHLSWEVNGTSMSDDWSPEEITATSLLWQWAKRYGQPQTKILWTVWPLGEFAPFQTAYPLALTGENFLSYFDWPVHAHTGERLNFNRLPVLDGEWSSEGRTKGGFFQEATGWKPAPLQPYADLESIFQAAGLPVPPIVGDA